jgi:DNA-binding SARP family transcriptional activator
VNPDDGAVTATTRFRLRLLGFPAVSSTDGSPVPGLGPGKPLGLLAYLAVRREARRDELVDLLWGEVSEANARNAFRQALHRLRTGLGDEIIPQDRDHVQLTAADRIEIDRDELVDAIDRGDIAGALELYRGDFLEGFELGEPGFDGWADAERTRLKGRFQSALQEGAETALAAGRWLEALQYVQKLTALAPFDEAAALLEANVLVAAGRSVEALTSLRRFTTVLRDQLDLAPSAKIRDMLARIERAEPVRESSPARPKDSPFAGREAEMARLMGLLRDLASEQGATLHIEGPIGVGKTRLVAEFIARARSVGPLLVLRGRERPIGSTLPYASVAEALRGSLKAPGVAGTGRHLLAEAARLLPELRDSYDLPDVGPVDSEGGRLRFFEGIAALLDSAAYEQPVCIVLDDMHHASPATLELLGYLSARLLTSPVLVVLLYRDDVDAARIRRLRPAGNGAESREAVSLALGPLDDAAIRAVVEGVAQTAGAHGQLDVDRLIVAAAGNPLRAVELSRRALRGELPTTTVSSLRDILWARLQAASPSQRRVFFAAALMARAASLRLLAAAAHLPETATLDAARDLERLGLLAQEGDAYVLAHDFSATFVAESSGRAGRALLAGWAADALAADPAPPNTEVANLYSIAGQASTAFPFARRAAYDAAAMGATSDVNRLLGLARTLAPDAKSRAEVEGMLAGFGAGRKLLGAPAGGPAAPIAEAPGGQRAPSGSPPAPRKSHHALFTPRLGALVIAGALLISIAIAWSRHERAATGLRALRDSLLVSERGNERGDNVFVITGSIDDASRRALGIARRDEPPAWVKSLQLPWIRPSVSPAGLVASERMTETGTDVFLLPGPGAAPVPVSTGPGTDALLGWSPDGLDLLVRRSRTLPDGSFDADLWAYRLAGGNVAVAVPLDTSATRSVEDEAAWSPDGSRIAWVARVGSGHQREVFVSRADGAGVMNLTDNPAEDYHVAWSPDGNLLAFTSDRDGNPDLYAVEFGGAAPRVWRLTNAPGDEDFASFSPDHRFVAFQSTAGGDAAVYIMPALGGLPVRVTPAGGQFSIAGWRGKPAESYLDRIRILGPTAAAVGDTVAISLFGIDRNGNPRLPDSVDVRLLQPTTAVLRLSPARGASHSWQVLTRGRGVVRVLASIPGWRDDTLAIDVGGSIVGGLSDDFSNGISPDKWIVAGAPRPEVRPVDGGFALFPRADQQWQSGILSRREISLGDSVDVEATLRAPFDGSPVAGAELTLAIVRNGAGLDSVAPQLNSLVGVSWNGEASRLTYSVGAQSKSDPLSALGAGGRHRMRIVVSRAGEVSFYVDARLRWTSSLRFLGSAADQRGRLWLGGRATSTWGAIGPLEVRRP